MKQNKLFLGLATMFAAAFTFTACSSDDAESRKVEQTGQKINFVYGPGVTRTVTDPQSSTSVATGLNVGIFGVSSEGTTTMSNYTNNKYVTADAGAINLASGSSNMTWPTTANATASIYAYAPYQENWTVNTANSFAVLANQTTDANYLASDLLYASAISQAQNTNVVLSFSHKLSKVNITIKKASGSNVTLNGATVKIKSTKLTTSLNPTTGALGDASGDATDITAATIASELEAGNESSTATACAVIVPQTLVASTAFVEISTTDSKTLIGKLSEATTFASGQSYNMTVSVGNVTETVTEVPISLGTASLVAWTNKNIGLTAYGKGDFVLADGTCITSEQITEANKSQIAGVIFSTSVSATDRTAGYNAYAMGLTRMKNRTWGFDDEITAGPTTLAAGLADLDGRTKTSAVVNSGAYTTYVASNTNHVATLSSYTPALTGANMSGWFVPSFGQMVQILNNLGGANISESTITAASFGTGSSFYVYASDNSESKVAPATIISNISYYVVTKAGKSENVLTTGNITVATISESDGTKFWTFALTSNGEGWELGAAAGKTPKTDRSVIPCFAVAVPAVAQ